MPPEQYFRNGYSLGKEIGTTLPGSGPQVPQDTRGFQRESEHYKLDGEGEPLTKYHPTNLAIAANGDIYVGGGGGSSYINQYDREGKFIQSFGGEGAGPGQLSSPHGITIDNRGEAPLLLVADRSNNRLQYFTLEGKHLSFVAGVNLPCHFDERNGILLIPDLGGPGDSAGPE